MTTLAMKMMDNTDLLDKKRIGKRLQALRKSKGLKQREVAEMLKITTSTYGGYECGAALITLESAIRLARHYGCSIEHIIGTYQYYDI